MLNYIPFYPKIWSDKRFKKLSVDAKLLFIYMFANDAVNLTGIYEFDLDVCKLKMNMNNIFDDTFNEVVASRMIEWDKDTETIFIINRFNLIPNHKSPKVIEGAIKELNTKKHHFNKLFIEKYKDILDRSLPNLKEFKNDNLYPLTSEQLKYLIKIGWGEQKIKRSYLDSGYSEQKIDDILKTLLPKQ